jgi:hypothetical protein
LHAVVVSVNKLTEPTAQLTRLWKWKHQNLQTFNVLQETLINKLINQRINNKVHRSEFFCACPYAFSLSPSPLTWTLVRFLNRFWLGEGHAIEQMVEALCYKVEGRGFNSRWSQWKFFIDINLLVELWP